jgi:hypothetical protein
LPAFTATVCGLSGDDDAVVVDAIWLVGGCR